MGLYEFRPEDAFRFSKEVGVEVRTRGDELQFKECPYCRGGAHHDSWTFAINLKTGAHNCRRASCGARGNMIRLSKDFDFSLGTDVDEYYKPKRRYKTIKADKKPVPKPGAVEYMEKRGISREVCEQYNLTTRNDHENILVFPFYDENEILTFVKYRKMDFDKAKGDRTKEWCEEGCKPILFGMNHADPENGTLVLTEGQIDSLSCAEAGIQNAVSVPTGAKGFTWVPYCWDFLGKFNTLIVFGDNENDQITLLDEMSKRFQGTVKHVRPEDYLGCKDANEILMKHGKDAIRAAIKNAVLVRNSSLNYLNEIERVDLSQLERFSTGIKSLDKVLGGLFFGRLVLLTGQRGEGKSTFASQLGTRAMAAGYPVMFYSGELADWFFRDWIDRQIAGPEYIISSQSIYGNMNYSIKDRYVKLIAEWYKDLAVLFNHRAIRDGETEENAILRAMEAAIKQYGCRVLIIDNLMTAMSDDLSLDLYRQQSNFVKRLASMAENLNVLIILIVHPRKTNTLLVNDDVAGSANITNLADVVMSYTRPADEHAEEDEREIRILKNRITGKLTRTGIPVYFEEGSKRISETEEFDWKLGWEKLIPTASHPVSESDQLTLQF